MLGSKYLMSLFFWLMLCFDFFKNIRVIASENGSLWNFV